MLAIFTVIGSVNSSSLQTLFLIIIFSACSFDAIISADLFVNLKPAPDIFLAAAKILGLQPHEVHKCLGLPLMEALQFVFSRFKPKTSPNAGH